MRPSSSTSDHPRDLEPEPGSRREQGGRPAPGGRDFDGLFDEILARGPVRAAVSDTAWLAALLAVEAALARAEARAGVIDPREAEEIARACRPDAFDVAALGREAAAGGNPVVPLVRALRAAVGGAASDVVHLGATSQDILDSAAMLVARDALDALLVDLRAASDAAADLARAHRDTVMAARTLLQHAVPTTFGLKAAGWMTALDEAGDRLDALRRTGLAVQLGGAAGTLASLGTAGLAVRAALAAELGLPEPSLAWHTDRARIGDLAGGLGIAAGAVGKVALDVVLLGQTEVGEVAEGVAERGGSSTLPHKHNPIAAVSALAGARQAPGLVASLLASMLQEHERAAGAWHAEWRPLRDLLATTGSAVAWLRDCLEHLQVDPKRMRENLGRSGGAVLAERVVAALTPKLGAAASRSLVAEASAEVAGSGRTFADVLAAQPAVAGTLSERELRVLLDPSGYLGSALVLTDRALAAHDAGRPGR